MTVPHQSVRIAAADVALEADIALPERAQGVVLFAHGSGSSRHSPRNRYVAEQLQHAGLATVLADLLTAEEERIDALTAGAPARLIDPSGHRLVTVWSPS